MSNFGKKMLGHLMRFSLTGSSAGTSTQAPPPADEKKPDQQTPPAQEDKPKDEGQMSDSVKAAFDAASKLTPEEMEAFQGKLSDWIKAKAAAEKEGASPEKAAQIATLQQQIAALEGKVSAGMDSMKTLTENISTLTQKMASGADPVKLGTPGATGGDGKKRRSMADAWNQTPTK